MLLALTVGMAVLGDLDEPKEKASPG